MAKKIAKSKKTPKSAPAAKAEKTEYTDVKVVGIPAEDNEDESIPQRFVVEYNDLNGRTQRMTLDATSRDEAMAEAAGMLDHPIGRIDFEED